MKLVRSMLIICLYIWVSSLKSVALLKRKVCLKKSGTEENRIVVKRIKSKDSCQGKSRDSRRSKHRGTEDEPEVRAEAKVGATVAVRVKMIADKVKAETFAKILSSNRET